MGFWPFGSGAKKQRPADGKNMREKDVYSPPLEEAVRSRKADVGSQETSYQSPRRELEPRTSRAQLSGAVRSTTPRSVTAPASAPGARQSSPIVEDMSEKNVYRHNPVSQSSLQPERFNVTPQAPTLRAPRPAQDTSIARRKSSKRKAEEHAREREIKAMSSSPIPIPRRPSSLYGQNPMERERREIPGALNRKLRRPTSEVSLPLPDPFAGADDLSKQNSWKVGIFAALSPRPTVRYDEHSRSLATGQKAKLLPQPIVEEDGFLADRKRIDNLADDLNASALRDLMERDDRRRERKKLREEERLQRRLQRKADRQREEEARRLRTENFVSGKPATTGLQTESEQKISEVVEAGPSIISPQARITNPFTDQLEKEISETPKVIRNPFEDEKDEDVMRDDDEIDAYPVMPSRSPLREIQTSKVGPVIQPSQAALSPPITPAGILNERLSLSQGSLLNQQTRSDLAENSSQRASLDRRASDQSSQRLSSWTSFFKKGTRRTISNSISQGRNTPSEFSNTSRESFQRRQATGPPPGVVPRSFRDPSSSTPQRTMSKFKEELSGLPASPPDSGQASPAVVVQSSLRPVESTSRPTGTAQSASTPSRAILLNSVLPAPVPENLAEEKSHPVLVSQSLASVDSEASWLSGRPVAVKRLSGQTGLRASRSSLSRPPGTIDERIDSNPLQSIPSTNERGREDLDVDVVPKAPGETWHSGVGRQPTLVRQASRARSKEGLLKEYTAGQRRESDTTSDENDDDGEEAEIIDPEPTILRARSVEYKGGHGRKISAGSARLLNIRPTSTYSDGVSRTNSTIVVKDDTIQEQSP